MLRHSRRARTSERDGQLVEGLPYSMADRAPVHASAVIVPVHHEGWAHYSEARDDVARVFARTGLGRRVTWLQPGAPL
jgi:hypothetical protein